MMSRTFLSGCLILLGLLAASAADLRIRPAVELTFSLRSNQVTSLQASADLDTWSTVESWSSTGNSNVVHHVAGDEARRFFRLEEQSFDDVSLQLATIISQRRVPALVTAAVRSNVVVAAGVAGVRKVGVSTAPVTLHDRFHVGSCTKSMTAMLAGVLVDQGVVTWEDTVGAAFPELQSTMVPAWRPVTLRQLLQNRGGGPSPQWLSSPTLSGNLWARLWTNQVMPADQRQLLVQEVTRRPPEVAPGTAYLYSNAGFAIAGRMLERAAGQPWEELMQARLFRPLGIRSAGFGVPASPRYLNQPWGHTWSNGPLPVEPGTDADNPPSIGPAGTAHLSVLDFARYAAAQVRAHLDGLPILSQATARALHDPVPVNANYGYAMGWEVVNRPWGNGKVLTHTGSNNQWFAVMWLAPGRDFAAVAICNVAGNAGAQATDDAVALLVQRYAL